jgi:hypothetical protein
MELILSTRLLDVAANVLKRRAQCLGAAGIRSLFQTRAYGCCRGFIPRSPESIFTKINLRAILVPVKIHKKNMKHERRKDQNDQAVLLALFFS